MFDEKSIQNLQYYVYALIDPRNSKVFYIGKGTNNRVFDHAEGALKEQEDGSNKIETIKEILRTGQNVEHIIIRHGLTEEEAFHIEASIIDFSRYLNINLSNVVLGHNSIEKGLMTADEIVRLYNAPPLNSIDANCIIININKKYKRGSKCDAIYKATKSTWSIAEKRLPLIKYVLSEYRGLIVGVFEVEEWHEEERGYNPGTKKYGQMKIGYGFEGHIAPTAIRDKYINKSIAHVKKRGAATAIRYNL